MLLPCILALLVPPAIYCWVMACINRRSKPTIIPGLWDFLGLTAAAGGILLFVAPALISRFFLDLYLEAFAMEWWWASWAAYFSFMVLGVLLMARWRQRETVIYNVDVDMWDQVFQRCLDSLGLDSVRTGDHLTIRRAGTNLGNASPPPCELIVNVFPAMRNVSLRWLHAPHELRAAVEKRLRDSLESARVYDNPAAYWLFALAGVLFGFIFLAVAVWFLINYFPPRYR